MATVQPTEQFKTTAEALLIAKARTGLTNKEIADRAECGIANLATYIRGEVIPQDLRIVTGLARALDLPREWLEAHIERDVQAAARSKRGPTLAALALVLTAAQCGAEQPLARTWPEFFDRHWFAVGLLISWLALCVVMGIAARNRPPQGPRSPLEIN